MTRRHTGIGAMFARDRDEAREALRRSIVLAGGNVVRIAHLLTLSRRHVYRLIYRERMWGAVDDARRARAASLRPALEIVEARRRLRTSHDRS